MICCVSKMSNHRVHKKLVNQTQIQKSLGVHGCADALYLGFDLGSSYMFGWVQAKQQ